MRKSHSITAFLLIIVLINACQDHSTHPGQQDTSAKQAQKMQNMPGMPGMNAAQPDHSEMIKLSAREQLLAGIHTDVVRLEDFRETTRTLGIVALDESTASSISSKVRGRIDRLYLRNPGEELHAGQAMYDIYSETLLAEEQDLLQLIQSNQPATLIEAARIKLRLHGLSDAQLVTIEKQKSTSGLITVYSTVSGFLSALRIREGQYVETGDVLFEIGSLDRVRINAQVYPDEVATFTTASAYEIEATANPGKFYAAEKIFENPSLEPNSKILMVRLRSENPDHFLKPGMMTTVRMKTPPVKLLAISKEAVLIENGMSFAWVLETDGMFSRRMVKTGKENETVIEITEGLKAGEYVVTSGVYLLNSEYVLRKGANTMGGMKM